MSEGISALVQIELHLAETITAIEGIVQRITDRKTQLVADFFADLRDELEVIENAVNRLDQTFIELVVAYADEDIINDPAILKELGRITRNYLTQRKILPSFEHSIGAIKGLASDPQLNIYPQLRNALVKLSTKLDLYHLRLGPGIMSGVGLEDLKQLLHYAEGSGAWVLDVQTKQVIQNLVQRALDGYSFDLSGEIRRLLGQAQFYARANIPRRHGFFGQWP